MLGLSSRAVAFYAAFGFPFALFCAIPYFHDHTSLDASEERRRLRYALALTVLAPVHVLFPLTAWGIVRDAGQLASTPENAATRHRLQLVALAGIACSVVTFVVVARVVAA